MTSPFIEPVLARCDDRTQLAPQNTAIGAPEDWFLDSDGVSFDFFIDWRNDTLDREVWLKRPIRREIVGDPASLSDDEILDLLRNDAKFASLVNFAGNNGLTAAAILFDDAQDWNSPAAKLVKVTWPKNPSTQRGLLIQHLTRADIQQLIRQKSGGPVKIGSKGLIYGTSRLECMLSSTDSLWPGDVDFVLCDGERNRIGILEFKKHTAGSKLALDQQCLGNYYPYPDGRKYDRLALLAAQLRNEPIPLIVIYYSVVQGCVDLYIELVSGRKGQLRGGRQIHYTLDPADLQASAAGLVALLRSML